MKVSKIECKIVVVPDYDPEAGSSAQDDIVVLVHTDEGITGIGRGRHQPLGSQVNDRGQRNTQHWPGIV